VEGDQRLFNQYGVMLVNPAKHAHIKKEMGQQFIEWVVRRRAGRIAVQDRWRAVVLPQRQEVDWDRVASASRRPLTG